MPECDFCGREFATEHAVKSHKGKGHDDPWQDEDKVRELYVNKGLTTTEMADRWGCDSTTIQNWINRFEIKTEDPPWYDEEKVRELYIQQRLTCKEISDRWGCSRNNIQYWLKKHGIDARGVAKNRATLYNRRGYQVWTCGVAQKSVPVHRLVAVAEFGFKSVAGKVIHHKNGVRWDNRPRNLEAMTHEEHTEHHHENGDFPW